MNSYTQAEKEAALLLANKAFARYQKSNNPKHYNLIRLQSRGDGKAAIDKWISKPLKNASDVKERHDKVIEHLNKGGRVALVPSSLGYGVIDFDLKPGQGGKKAQMILNEVAGKAGVASVTLEYYNSQSQKDIDQFDYAPVFNTKSRNKKDREAGDAKKDYPQGFHLWYRNATDNGKLGNFGKVPRDVIFQKTHELKLDILSDSYVVLHHPTKEWVNELFADNDITKNWKKFWLYLCNDEDNHVKKNHQKEQIFKEKTFKKKTETKRSKRNNTTKTEQPKEEDTTHEEEGVIIDAEYIDKPFLKPAFCSFLDDWKTGERWRHAIACYQLARGFSQENIDDFDLLSDKEISNIVKGKVTIGLIASHHLYCADHGDADRVNGLYKENLEYWEKDKEYKKSKQEKQPKPSHDDRVSIIQDCLDLGDDQSFSRGCGCRKAGTTSTYRKIFTNETDPGVAKVEEGSLDYIQSIVCEEAGYPISRVDLKTTLLRMFEHDFEIKEQIEKNVKGVSKKNLFFRPVNTTVDAWDKYTPAKQLLKLGEVLEFFDGLYNAPEEKEKDFPDFKKYSLFRCFQDNIRNKFYPGALIRHHLLLQGPPGCGKSSFPRMLAGVCSRLPKRLSLNSKDLDKDQRRIIARYPVAELTEILIGGETRFNHLKGMLGETDDIGRDLYVNEPSIFYRMATIVATKNEGSIFNSKFRSSGFDLRDLLSKFMIVYVTENHAGFKRFKENFDAIFQSCYYYLLEEQKYYTEKWGEKRALEYMKLEHSASPPGKEVGDWFYKQSGISRECILDSDRRCIDYLLSSGCDTGLSEVIDKFEDELLKPEVIENGWLSVPPEGQNGPITKHSIIEKARDRRRGKAVIMLTRTHLTDMVRWVYSKHFTDRVYSDLKLNTVKNELKNTRGWTLRDVRYKDHKGKECRRTLYLAPDRLCEKYYQVKASIEFKKTEQNVITLKPESNHVTTPIDETSMTVLEQDKQADDSAPMDSLEETLGF